jgi:hypothetical protein
VAQLLPGEQALWARLSPADRRHALLVARRFVAERPLALRAEIAAALLHDVGKVTSSLGTTARVVATVVGPRGARFRAYHAHEALGADLLAAAGSDPLTVALVRGEGAPAVADATAIDALHRADEI